MTVRWNAKSVQDLELIYAYTLIHFGPRQARESIRRIREAAATLRNFPNAGRNRPELGPKVRSLPASPYVIFYWEDRKAVSILRVLHGHRDIREPLMSLLIA